MSMNKSLRQVKQFSELFLEPTRNGIHKGPFYQGTGIPIIKMGEVYQNREIFNQERDLLELTLSEIEKLSVKNNDLLFCRTSLVPAGVGHCAIVRQLTRITTFASNLIRVRLDENKASSDFYLYYFSSLDGIEQLLSIARGTSVTTITGPDISSLFVPVPILDEQKKISNVLRSLDNKIELNCQMNETLEAMARAIFQSWFVDFDPVRAKAEGRDTGLPPEVAALFPVGFEESEGREVPRGWQIYSLYDSAQYINGAAFRNIEFSEDNSGLPVIKINELKNGITSQTKFTNQILDEKYKINSGEILLSWSGSPDTSIGTFLWSKGEGWLNQHIFKIIPNRSLEKFYIFFLLRHLNPIFIEMAKNKQTIGLGHFTVQDMKRVQIIFPPDENFFVFNQSVGPIYNLILNNDLQSNLIADIRDALLPKLMSGEIKVEAES